MPNILAIRDKHIVLFLLVLFGFACTVTAQDTSTGSISGTVTDPSDAAIKGATVTLINTDRGETIRTLTTNSAGLYTCTSLPLGTYSVKIVDSGVKTDTVTHYVLHAVDELAVNRTLSPGNESVAITITADEARVNLQDATSQWLRPLSGSVA